MLLLIKMINLAWRVLMKNKRVFLFALTLIFSFSFYRGGSAVTMASQQNMEPGVGSADSLDDGSEQGAESGDTSAADSEQESGGEQAGIPETESGGEQADTPEAESGGGSSDIPEAEPDGGLADVSETDLQPDAGLYTAQAMESAGRQDPEESVSTGQALIEWLESHKNTGGTVRLADHVVLDGEYGYCPNGMNMPTVLVDTAQYTITVAGEIELYSDNHLVFSGASDGKGIFYVAEKGMLSMQGITVESGQCALWQEEGAGLAVSSDCRISGGIHYADTPFVIDSVPVCAVVEKGQTVNDVLPTEISAEVIRQGQVHKGEPVSVSWDLDGTEKQQEQRRRFRLQGFFPQVSSAEPVQCTVVYNDYPLTFTEVDASVNGNCYVFRGWYTKPEETSPFTLISEYSFDAENWVVFNESPTEGTYADFIIVVDAEQTERTAHSNIYIRLQGNDNGTRYFSNVLCFAADNLENVEDIGGSRGGGTSIINPPGSPQKDTGTPKEKEADKDADHYTSADSDGDGVETPTTAGHMESGGKAPVPAADSSRSNTAASNAGGGQPFNAESPKTNEDLSLHVEPNAESRESVSFGESDAAVPENEEAVTASTAYGENGTAFPQMSERTLRPESPRINYIAIAAGFILLAVAAGTVGFFAYSQSGTKR